MSMWRSEAASLTSVHVVGFSLQISMYEMKNHLSTNADPSGNLWCHLEGCGGTHTPYRVNIWGLQKTATNRAEGRQMLEQQVRNVLRHLKDAHEIESHLVVKAILPKGEPRHIQVGNTCLVLSMFHLVCVSSCCHM